MKKYKVVLGLVLLCLIAQDVAYSQNFKSERRIYLWDITLSTFGFAGSPNIAEEVRSNLIKSINDIDNQQTEIVVIAFQDEVMFHWESTATTTGKRELIRKIERVREADLKPTNTNICNAWTTGIAQMSNDRRNYLFLLTDGEQNSRKVDPDCLKQNIAQWCDIAGRNDAFGFYVMLTEAARNAELEGIIEDCNRLEIVTGTDINVIELRPITTEIKLNVPDEEFEKELLFESNYFDGLPDGFQMKMSISENPFVELTNDMLKLEGKGQLRMQFTPLLPYEELRLELPESFEIGLNIHIDNQKYPRVFATPSELKVILKNIREKIMTIEIIEE